MLPNIGRRNESASLLSVIILPVILMTEPLQVEFQQLLFLCREEGVHVRVVLQQRQQPLLLLALHLHEATGVKFVSRSKRRRAALRRHFTATRKGGIVCHFGVGKEVKKGSMTAGSV